MDKAVESIILDTHETPGFRMAVAEMNGWRPSMEDAHLAHIREDWAFFGIFDGHAGKGCSDFVAKRIGKDLQSNGCPSDNGAVKRLIFQVDQEFLSTSDQSGSTGTMCIVTKPTDGSTSHQLRIINVGDSRILLGSRDGSIIDGGGTDKGLTTDHKPDNKEESERIIRCGGTVEEVHGVARVNGGLAVSRAFGDSRYKLSSGGPFPEDRPVTVDPELKQLMCEGSNFLVLVCDGVSEGSFPNSEVVKLAAKVLRDTDDVGLAAKAVCYEALKQESHDNISCMIVLLDGSSENRSSVFEPGTTSMLGQKEYRATYTAMAEKAGLSLAQAIDKRFQLLNVSDSELDEKQKSYLGDRCNLKEELANLGSPVGEPGSQERLNYFVEWLGKLPEVESKVSDEVKKKRMRKEEALPFTMVAGRKEAVMAKIDNPVTANLKSEDSLQVDTSKPVANIQIRFHDGSKKTQQFNQEHTVGDLRTFCAQVTGQPMSIKGGYPTKLLTDDAQSVKDAGLCGALVNVAPIAPS